MQASPYLKTPVKIWLVIGLVMIFFQIIIGGITRLTGSGLSITKWDIVTGAIPPLNHDQWQDGSIFGNTYIGFGPEVWDLCF